MSGGQTISTFRVFRPSGFLRHAVCVINKDHDRGPPIPTSSDTVRVACGGAGDIYRGV